MMDVLGQPRPRRRRPPTRGLLFGAPLDRVPSPVDGDSAAAAAGGVSRRPDPIPIALIGESNPVSPPRVESFGAMAAAWPLVDRSDSRPSTLAAPTEWATFAPSLARSDRCRLASGPVDGVERRWGGLSASEWQRLLGH